MKLMKQESTLEFSNFHWRIVLHVSRVYIFVVVLKMHAIKIVT